MHSFSTLLDWLVPGHVTYTALIEAGRCVCVRRSRIEEARPRYAALLPEWGMGAGIVVFAQRRQDIDEYVKSQPDGHLARIFHLQGDERHSDMA